MPTIREKLTIDFPHANADDWYGPYASKEEACSKIKYSTSSLLNRRAIGLTVGIYIYNKDGGIGGIKEYWWRTGIKDEDLVEKQMSTSSIIYLSQTEWNELTDNGTNFERLEAEKEYAIYEDEPESKGCTFVDGVLTLHDYSFDNGVLILGSSANFVNNVLTLRLQ